MVNNIKPPANALKLLRWYCSVERYEEISGDVEEVFEETLAQQGLAVARIKCWLLVLKCYKPYAYKKPTRHKNSNFMIMFSTNLKVAYRNFTRHLGYSAINVTGLVIGMVSCLLIALHVERELSFDRFHNNANHIYRIQMDRYSGSERLFQSAVTYPAVGANIANDLASVEDVLRILPFGNGVYKHVDDAGNITSFDEAKGVFADHNFFQIFDFQLLKGSVQEALNGPNKVVISETTAKKYFRDKDPIGKTLNYRGRQDLEVTGVMADMPTNSHMSFDLIQSLESQRGFERFPENWGWYDFYTFIRMDPTTDLAVFEKQLQDFFTNNMAESFDAEGIHEKLQLQPLTDIHLYSKLNWDMGDNGGAEAVSFLTVIALIIMIIAWSNFVNLATAQATKRAKEIGVRKSLGAYRGALVSQFLVESFLYNFIALLLAAGIVILVIPSFNTFADLSITTGAVATPKFILALTALLTTGTLLSGLYPAFVLTSFDPIKVLKGNTSSKLKGSALRKLLVIFQFCISVVLIAGTLMVIRQVNYMKAQDLGISLDQTLVLVSPTSIADRQDLVSRSALLRNQLNDFAEIQSVSFSSSLPGRENFAVGGYFLKSRPDNYQDIFRVAVDYSFITDFEIAFLGGRNFSPDFPSDSNALILNKIAIERFQIENPEAALSESIVIGEEEYHIVGVIESYHQESLKKELDPVMFTLNSERGRYISLKLGAANLPALVSNVEKTWKGVFPDSPLNYYFLDDHFDQQYRSDEIFNRIFIGFACLAIFVACLGLFGLVSFTAAQSVKEISIRKVLGSTLVGIMVLLSKEFIRMISISMVLAFPLAWYLMDQWLATFPYRTAIRADIFVVSGLLIFLVAITTVSYQTIKAARTNPATVLRNE